MGSIPGFVGRRAGVLIALVIAPVFFGLPAPEAPRLRLTRVLSDQDARVLEFSPDSRVILTEGDLDSHLRDAATGRVRVTLRHAGPEGPSSVTNITWPRFTPDGRYLIVQITQPEGDGPEQTVTVAVFEVATGRESASFARVGSKIGAEYALSADGTMLAFTRVADRETGQVTVWDIASEKVVEAFPGYSPLAWSPDGTALAHAVLASVDRNTLRVVLSLAPDGTPVAHAETASSPPFPTIHKLTSVRPATPRVRGSVDPTGSSAGPIAFSADGALLAAKVEKPSLVPREELTIEVRDSRSGRIRAVLYPNGTPASSWFQLAAIGFSADGRKLFLEDFGGYAHHERVQVWDLSGRSPRMALEAPVESLTPDGSRVAVTEFNHFSRQIRALHDTAVKVLDLPSERDSGQSRRDRRSEGDDLPERPDRGVAVELREAASIGLCHLDDVAVLLLHVHQHPTEPCYFLQDGELTQVRSRDPPARYHKRSARRHDRPLGTDARTRLDQVLARQQNAGTDLFTGALPAPLGPSGGRVLGRSRGCAERSDPFAGDCPGGGLVAARRRMERPAESRQAGSLRLSIPDVTKKATSRTRTEDFSFTKAALYQLS